MPMTSAGEADLVGHGPTLHLRLPVLEAVAGLAHAFTAAGSDVAAVTAALASRPLPLWRLSQVHGAAVVAVEASDPAVPPERPPTGDALLTARRKTALTVHVADCVPILLADPVSGPVGAAPWPASCPRRWLNSGSAGVGWKTFVSRWDPRSGPAASRWARRWSRPSGAARRSPRPASSRGRGRASIWSRPTDARHWPWGSPTATSGARVFAPSVARISWNLTGAAAAPPAAWPASSPGPRERYFFRRAMFS